MQTTNAEDGKEPQAEQWLSAQREAELMVKCGDARTVIAFGSHARADAKGTTPVDLAAVVIDDRARRKLRARIATEKLEDLKRAVVWPIVVTREELRKEASFANALGGVIGDGKVMAGDELCVKGIEVRKTTTDELALCYASAMEQLGLANMRLRTDGARGSWIVREWDAWHWFIGRVRQQLTASTEPAESFEQWEQRRLTTLAVVGAEQVARLVAASEGLTQTGIRHLNDQMAKLAQHSPGREPWRLEHLGRATQPRPGPEPRKIAPGQGETQHRWAKRVEGGYDGIAWWLRHGDNTPERTAQTLRHELARRGTQRWICGTRAIKHNRNLEEGVRRALDTVRDRIGKTVD